MSGFFFTYPWQRDKIKPPKWACLICHKQSTRKRKVDGRTVVICQNCELAKKP